MLFIDTAINISKTGNIMSLFGKPWRELLSLKSKNKEGLTVLAKERVKLGDMVIFCKNPPADQHHCNIWEWATGILIDINLCTGEASILTDGEIYNVGNEWVGPVDLLAPSGGFK